MLKAYGWPHQSIIRWAAKSNIQGQKLAWRKEDLYTMKKEIITIPGIHSPETSFNHVVRAGNFLFLTSQVSADLRTGKILGGDIREQTRQALENIKLLLTSCGATMDDVVKAIVYLRHVNDRHKVNQVYGEYFTKGQEPAKVTVQAPSPIEGIDIEIEVTAVLPS